MVKVTTNKLMEKQKCQVEIIVKLDVIKILLVMPLITVKNIILAAENFVMRKQGMVIIMVEYIA